MALRTSDVPSETDIRDLQMSPSDGAPATIVGRLEAAVLDARGWLTVRGWVVSLTPVEQVRVRLDERLLGDAHMRMSRADVGAAFPAYPEADRSGFVLRIDGKGEALTGRQIRVQVAARGGRRYEIVGSIEDERDPPIPIDETASMPDRPEIGRAIDVAAGANLAHGLGPQTPDLPLGLPAPIIARLEDTRVNDRAMLTVRGWAVSLSPIEHVHVYLGDKLLGVAELGISREDVGLAQPDYPDANESGFLLQQEVSDAEIAERVVRVKVLAAGDIRRELVAPLVVAPVIRRTTRRADGGEVHFHCDNASLGEDGTIALGGWAICASGIEAIEVDIDGEAAGQAETGLNRPDVGNAYPHIQNARKAGFRVLLQTGRRYEGEHVVRIVARGRDGEERVVLQPVLARAGVASAGAGGVASGDGAPIRFYLDSPRVEDGRASEPIRGFLSVAGWAIADEGVAGVEVFVDGQPQGRAFYGVRREDLQNAMPDRDVLLSGFAMLIPPQVMRRGMHDVTVVVRDKSGNTEEQSFSVEAKSSLDGPGPWALRRKITQAELDLAYAMLDHAAYRPRWTLLLPLDRVAPGDVTRARATLASMRTHAYTEWRMVVAIPEAADCASLRASLLKGHEHLSAQVEIAPLADGMALAALAPAECGPALVCLLGPGDRLGDDALLELSLEAAVATGADFLYSDERRVDPSDQSRKAFFKPDWSPDLLLSTNYIGRLWAATPDLLRRVDLRFGDLDRFGEYDAVLRLTEQATRIVHAPKVLAGRRARHDTPGVERRALARALRRRGIEGQVLPGCLPGHYRVKRDVRVQGMVSIIIPSIATRGLIKVTIDSIRAKTAYSNYEILVLDNIRANDDPEKVAWKLWMRENADKTVEIRERFNWSRFNNRGARQARGEFLLFLNDDMEVLDENWLDALLEHAQRPDVGVVGPQLLYPDGKVQHAGMFLSGRVARHAFRFSPRDEPGTFGLALTQRNVISVTGACLMTSRAMFDKLGGFDEAHTIVNNDLDYCLRVRRAGRLVVYQPHTTLIHHEMVSRSKIADVYDTSRFESDWKDLFLKGDPYFSPHLGTDSDDYLPDAERLRVLSVGHPLIARERVRRILAIKVDHIGDFIAGFPAFQRLKQHYPDAELCVLAAKASMQLAKLEPSIDRVIEFNFFHARSEKGLRPGIQKQLAELRETLAPMRFDIALDLRRHADTRRILQYTGARWLAGFDIRNEHKWLDVAVEWEGDHAREAKRIHVTDALVQLTDAVAVATRSDRRVIHSPQAKAEARAELAALANVAPMAEALFSRRVVCMHTSVGSMIRQWPSELFGGLIDLLVGDAGVNILLIGGPDEVETVNRVMESVRRPEHVFSVVGKIGLSNLPKALLACDLYVGNNSGPQHLAGALGVPAVGIHSGTVDAAEWGPMGPFGAAITRGMACSPCYLSKATDCHRGLACLHKVRVGDVYRLCLRMLTLSL